MVIYKITNLINNKIYIGQTIKTLEHRWKRHLQLAKNGINRHLYDSIRHYGEENFKIEEFEKCTSKKELNERERFWISELKSNQREFGYNMNDGGTGGKQSTEIIEKIAAKRRGTKSSEETKKKQSEAAKGKIKTKEHLENISKALTGIKRSEETKRKISLVTKGRISPMKDKHHSEETRERLSKVRSGKPLEEIIGLEAANKIKEISRKRFIENNPNYKEVNEEELKNLLLRGLYLEDIAHHFNVTRQTIINKIKKYWNVKGADEFRKKFLVMNRKRGPYKK